MTTSIRAEAERLQAAGYAVMGVDLCFDTKTSSKVLHCKTNWPHARVDTCLNTMFLPDDNALAILTGTSSDVLGVDLDALKPKDIKAGLSDAIQAITTLIDQHGLDPSVPKARTPSGGIHLLFKLSSSLAAGLNTAANGAKVADMTLDVRGDAGCLLCHPSGYSPDQKYRWETPIVPAVDLPPAPGWLINLLNQRKLTPPADPPAKRQRTLQINDSNALSSRVQQQLTKLSPSLRMDKVWPRLGGLDFCMCDRTCSCPLCGNVHLSNQYTARVVLESAWIMGNYSTSCRSQVFGWEACSLLKQLIYSPKSDDSFCKILLAAYLVQNRTVVFTAANRYLSFNGVVWEDIHVQFIKQDIKALIPQVITPLIVNIPKTEETAPKIKALVTARNFLEKAHNVSSVIQTFQTFAFDGHIEDTMDTNPDLLAVANGVIHLPTATLDAGKGSQKLSMQLTTAYRGNPTPLIDDFFASIFNNDMETIRYMQRLLGYGITGHTRQQVWAIWTGSGSNGKSLLMAIVMKLLGPFAVSMPGEVLFESGKTTAGACTPHMQCLIKKRIGFKDEGKSAKANTLNEERIKEVTGTTPIATKPLYKEVLNFLPSHLPILLCNRKPHVDITDKAMLRRIIVIPFVNTYTDPDSKQIPYDTNNPTHRLRDNQLEDKLTSEDGQEQLLTWLVAGAQSWYDQGLGRMPPAVGQAFDSYCQENDHLTAFLKECVESPEATCNASQFRQAYIAHCGIPIKQKDLRDQMAKRGFKYCTKTCCYKGLQTSE